jgi:hypothetical protein
MRCSPGPLDPHAHTLLQIGLMNIRNEEKRIGWAACALARHVDAIVARDDDSDDGTGMCPLISAVQTPQVPDCPSFPPLLSSGGAVASAAALRIRAQPHPCTQALEVSRSTPRPLRRPLFHRVTVTPLSSPRFAIVPIFSKPVAPPAAHTSYL